MAQLLMMQMSLQNMISLDRFSWDKPMVMDGRLNSSLLGLLSQPSVLLCV